MPTFLTDNLAFLQYPFMQRALIASFAIGLLCAVVGVYVTLRSLSFFSDAISHAALAGIALSERMKLRHWGLFGLGGGLIGLAAYAMAIGWAGGPASAFPLIALVTAGAAGGCVYRLVAGGPRSQP